MKGLFNPDDSRPRVDNNVCGKCRRKFERGHRVTTAYIFDSSGLNPRDFRSQGVYLEKEFELVHIDCKDPTLTKGLVS